MKAILILVACFAAFPLRLSAAPAVVLTGRAYTNADTLILDIYADIAVEMRTFGLKVGFDASLLNPRTVTVDDSLWFLAATPGVHLGYTSSTTGQDSIRIVGARFSASAPRAGVQGNGILLASIYFSRIAPSLPSRFDLALAGPAGYTSFAGVDSLNHDSEVSGLGAGFAIRFYSLPVDSDGDGLPDDYETAVFGGIGVSNGRTDSDGDGASDYEEWFAGTDPRSSSSLTFLKLEMQPDSSRKISWTGVQGRTYRLLWSASLSNFVPIAEGIVPASPNQITDPSPSRTGFYRLQIDFPAAGH
ncbi:MAG TPA: thrombospondin type 3 repeat-containing protein [Verrucomicrobiae bacterium]